MNVLLNYLLTENLGNFAYMLLNAFIHLLQPQRITQRKIILNLNRRTAFDKFSARSRQKIYFK